MMKIPEYEEVYNDFFIKLQKKEVPNYEQVAKIESEKFYDYWQSRSWTYGKTKITRWTFSVNTWIRNIKNFNQNKDETTENRSFFTSYFEGRK